MSKHPLDNICSIEEFCKRHPYLGFNRERFTYILKTQDYNGIMETDCLVKIGRKYYLKDDNFCDWYYKYVNKNRKY